LELYHLVRELQVLVGSRVDNVYDCDGFLFQFHKSGTGKLFLKISDKVLWLCASKPVVGEVSGLCSVLRKRLIGKKLVSVVQLGSERIVKFVFETREETYFVFVELFSNGNVVLTDGDTKILGAKEERAWKDREIRRGLKYILPPSKVNLFELDDIPFDEKSVASLGFGKLLAKEIFLRGGGMKGFKSLLSEPATAFNYAGELSPIRLVQFSSGKSYPSFCALIDSCLSSSVEDEKKERIRKSFESRRNKLLEVISAQSDSIDKFESRAVEFQRKGELIYEHYQELKDILDELNKVRSRFSLQDIRAKLKGHPKIKDLNPKTCDIIVEL